MKPKSKPEHAAIGLIVCEASKRIGLLLGIFGLIAEFTGSQVNGTSMVATAAFLMCTAHFLENLQ